MMAKDQFFIIDGHSQIYRFFYAPFQPLTAPDGSSTKATYLFTKMLFKLLREKDPAYLAVAMDGPRSKLARRSLDPDYKGNRPDVPSDVIGEVEVIKSILIALKIPMLMAEGKEADDIIATLATKCVSDDVDVVIVTGDMDLGQLLGDPRIRLFDAIKNEYLGAAEFQAKKGYPPELATQVMTLTGCPTDNIPTIPGWGPKTSVKWLTRCGSLAHLTGGRFEEEIPTRLMNSLNKAYLSGRLNINEQLVTLDRNVPLQFNPGQLSVREIDLTDARPIFQRLGFQRWYE